MSHRVLIVGGGIIGLSTAYYCARAGMQVTVLDRSPKSRNTCSFGNAGMIVPSHFIPLAAPGMVSMGLRHMTDPGAPFWIKPRLSWELMAWLVRFWRAANPAHVARCAPLIRDLSLASRACYEEMSEASNHAFELTTKGMMVLCRTPHALHDEAVVADRANEMGIPAFVLDSTAAAVLDPTVRMDITGAVHYPLDAHLTPQRVMHTLESALEALGVEMHWETEVQGWHAEQERLRAVRTSKGEFEANEFVLCGGVWSKALAQQLNLRIPLQAGKGYHIELENPRQLPTLCSVFAEARMAVTPMGGRLRFGGTMEITDLDHAISHRRVQRMIEAACKYFPEFSVEDFEDVEPWSGLRPCSPDGMPYLGRTAKWANLSLGCGHAMMGMSLGPISGKLIAESLMGEKAPWDLSPVSPDRFH